MHGLFLGVAVDHHVIGIALEETAGVLAVHPLVERIMHEEVGEQGRDRGPLRVPSPVPRGSRRPSAWGFEPPFDVEQDQRSSVW